MGEHERKVVFLECGHVVDARFVNTHRRKFECPGGCGWQTYEIVKMRIVTEDEDD